MYAHTVHSFVGTVICVGCLGIDGPLVRIRDARVLFTLRQDTVHVDVLLGLLCSLVGPLARDEVVCRRVAVGSDVHGNGGKLSRAAALHEEDAVVVWDMAAERERENHNLHHGWQVLCKTKGK